MRLRARLFGTLFLLAVSPASPALAQYMYLDANGDGVHTSADVLNPAGSTALDLWIRTDTNRDGSAAACATGEPLSLMSYDVSLRASNGRVNWIAFTNRQPTMTGFGAVSSATEYHNGFFGSLLPPGTYLLATLEVSPALGTPSLAIVPTTSLPGSPFTAFGSQCLGLDQDNTLKLGQDWFDTDGVAYGGSPQGAPVLAPIADMTVNESGTAEQTIIATDVDGQPLEFQKVSGPSFMSVSTIDPGSGTAVGKLVLKPGPLAAGSSTGMVNVSDGIASDAKSFGITVIVSNESPTIATDSQVSIGVPGWTERAIFASDPDLDPVQLTMPATPGFVLPFFFDLTTGPTYVSARYRMEPSLSDVGRSYLVLEATDQTAVGWARVQIDVTGPMPGAPPSPDLLSSSYTAIRSDSPLSTVARGDLDGDGILDFAAASGRAGTVDIYRGDGLGGFSLVTRLLGQKTPAVAVGDLNRDGVDDVVFVDRRTNELVVTNGPILGTALPGRRIPAGDQPAGLALGDMDRDGWLDAVVASGGATGVSVHINQRDGSLGSSVTYPTGGPHGTTVALGDVSGDGWLDVLVVRRDPHALDVLVSNRGALLPPVTRPSTLLITGLAVGRFNRDRMTDVAIAPDPAIFGSAGFSVLMSAGAGAFSPGVSYAAVSWSTLFAADMNSDRILDLLVGAESGRLDVRLGRADGSFGDAASYPGPASITSMVSFDADGDGDPDLIAGAAQIPDRHTLAWGGSGSLAVYRNRGGGTLTNEWVSTFNSTSGFPALADVNADGHLDIAGSNGVYLGTGTGTFAALIPGVGANTGFDAQAMIAADMNRDGHVDLVSARNGTEVGIWLGDGSGAFPPSSLRITATGLPSQVHAAVGDVNGDGIPDLVTGSTFYDYPAGPMALLLWIGVGDGTFRPGTQLPSSATSAFSIRIDDLDGDGHRDIVATDFYRSDIFALSGNGDGTFSTTRRALYSGLDHLFQSPTAMAWGDVNGDGLLDLVAGAYQFSLPVGVSLQRLDRTFSGMQRVVALGNYSSTYHEGLSLADMNGDGRLDLVTRADQSVLVALGDGSGSFGTRRYFSGSGLPLVGDVNEDGRPDIVLAGALAGFGPNDRIRVLLNQSALLDVRPARAFVKGEHRTVPVGRRGPDLCVRIEPVDGSYANSDLDPASIVMRSAGTGSTDAITAMAPKKPEERDTDHNGVAEIQACFDSADLAQLFSKLTRRQRITVDLEGTLKTGGRIHAELELAIVPVGARCAPTLTPNPLNPSTTFQFLTTRDGQVGIRVFDVHGRLVRAVLNSRLPAGEQEVFFDGRDHQGRALSSGIYFARFETVDGVYDLRLAIVK